MNKSGEFVDGFGKFGEFWTILEISWMNLLTL
jgi:hypothetical protein